MRSASQLRDRLKGTTLLWLVPPLATLVVLGFRSLGAMQSLELALYDRLFRWRSPEPVDDRVVIVGITEQDLTDAERWPIGDTLLAQLLEAVAEQEPRAIGLDLYRNLPVSDGEAEEDKLNTVIAATPSLIGIEKVVDNCAPANRLVNPWGPRGLWHQIQILLAGLTSTPPEPLTLEACTSRKIPPHPILAETGRIGFNDFPEDRDGRQRRAILTMELPDENGDSQHRFSLALRLVLDYLQQEETVQIGTDPVSGGIQLEDISFAPLERSDGGYIGTDVGGYQVLVNYRGPANHVKTVSLFDVVRGNIPSDFFRDRVVLIGPTAASLNDNRFTPYSNEMFVSPERMAGVEIHANVVSQLLSAALDGRPAMRTIREPWEWALTLAGAIAGAVVCWYWKGRWSLAVVTAGALGGFGLASHLAFARMWWIPVLPPISALAISAAATTNVVMYQERRDRQQVMNLFGRHVTAEVANAIWRDRDRFVRDGRMLGQRVTATVLFTDLKSFSTTSEKFDPEELLVWLNEYMEAMSDEVLARQGVVDKFIGDAVMAVFGVPKASESREEQAEKARQAVRCALAMGQRLEALNRQWQEQGKPTTAMRVGIATGSVVAGSLGSTQRLDYTTIGDTVNVAARLESYDKSIDGGLCRILIESETYALCGEEFDCQSIGEVTLKGRQQEASVYLVLGERSPSEGQE